jgi:gliding motility-associated-like protein
LKRKLQNSVFSILILISFASFGQEVSLYNQYNGKYDFTFIGNTMNLFENNSSENDCTILTSSSAKLLLLPDDEIENAYLYWAGSGPGDFEVKLNGNSIIAQRTFSLIQESSQKPFFSAFADVTTILQAQGNGGYTLSDLDISPFISTTNYCDNGTNFAGWAIVVVYKNQSLPNNQVNIYDGLESVPSSLTINLNSLNVVDTLGAKVGFVAWEGDRDLAVSETLRFNGNIISNPPLNPANNAFNGTNSSTGDTTLYNMDLDIYDIQNNIQVGDQNAIIKLTSGQDFVMINVVATKLNNEAPDATIVIDNISGLSCNSRLLTIDYTVSNFDSFEILPAGIPIAIYAGSVLVGTTQTMTSLPIGSSESGQITVTLPDIVPQNFQIQLHVDDLGTGIGIQSEIYETNNTAQTSVSLLQSPLFNTLTDLFSCISSLTSVSFDFSDYATSVLVNPSDTVQFFTSLSDANTVINPILNTTIFTVNTATTTIFVRLDNANCYSITSFDIKLIIYPDFNVLDPIFTCRVNQNSTFDFSEYQTLVKVNNSDLVSFFETSQDANSNINPILNFSNYLPVSTPKEVFVRIDNGFCQSFTSFILDYYELPKYNPLATLVSCNEGLKKGTFNFMNYDDLVKVNPIDTVAFFENIQDAENQTNPIITPSNYKATKTPKEIFVRLENDTNCTSITSFLLTTKNCPPTVYNYFSANGDTINPTFFVEGLRDIFLNFETKIYNRWGKLVWTGNNSTEDWDGLSNQQVRFDTTTISPRDTYYYVINLNDPDYPNPLVGWVYMFKKNQ